MERIIFTNSIGQSVELGDNAPYILTKVEGMGAVNTNIHTQKSPYQDGVTYIDNTLEPRTPIIEIMILAESEEKMEGYRRKLLQVFNPKLGPGKLIYEIGNIKREIEAISELAPVFPDAGDFKDTMQPGLIQLYCPNPYFMDPYGTSKEIITWIGGLKFPLKLPSIFSLAGPKIINVINDGDVETPLQLEIYGQATKPKIIKRATGEYIKVNRTLLSGDVLTISTEFGKKRVEQNGVNVFHYIDLNSTFFNLDLGDNVIELITEDVNDSANIKITYKNRYIGV